MFKPLAYDPTAINGMSERIVTGGLVAGLYTAPNTPGGEATANRHRQHEHSGTLGPRPAFRTIRAPRDQM